MDWKKKVPLPVGKNIFKEIPQITGFLQLIHLFFFPQKFFCNLLIL